MSNTCRMLMFLGLAIAPIREGLWAEEPRVIADSTLTLGFPGLPKMQDDLPAACEVRIPKTYDPAKPVPLLVWFTGGKGSHHVGGAAGLVDFDRFVVVALPYPGGRDMRTVIKEGEAGKVWAYQKVMLDRVRELVPNIDPEIRVAAGSSNGAHLIGTAMNCEWRGFCDYFTFFVLHEGGSAPSIKYPGAADKRLLVIWGEESEALKWQIWFNWRIGQSDAHITYHSVPDAGHGLTTRGRELIHTWIDEVTTSVPDR